MGGSLYIICLLNHDTLTDVITFDYSSSKAVSGEVFISVDRVRENAKEFHQDFNNEIKRVMIHGVLHLCGYNDKTAKDKALMSDMENRHLAFFFLALSFFDCIFVPRETI